MATKRTAVIYKILLLVASFAFIIIILRQLGTISHAIDILSQGAWYFILPVIGIQIIGVINRGAFYQSLYDYFGIKDNLSKLTKMYLASNFLNLAAPTGGLSGMAIFVAEAERHGVSKGRATFINFFAYFLYYLVFTLVLLFGLFYLIFNHQLYQYQIVTASILFGMILLIVIAGVAVVEEATRLNKLFNLVARVVNFFTRVFRKRSVLSSQAINLLSQEVHQSIIFIQKRWKALWLPIFHVFLTEAIDILTLYYLFLAFRYPIYPGILITAYAISVLFTLVSITPGGIGVVEAAMIFVFTNLGVPVELSAIVVFTYRIISYWFPFGLGFIAFRSLHSEKISKLERGTK